MKNPEGDTPVPGSALSRRFVQEKRMAAGSAHSADKIFLSAPALSGGQF
jgi:hypothetical protein